MSVDEVSHSNTDEHSCQLVTYIQTQICMPAHIKTTYIHIKENTQYLSKTATPFVSHSAPPADSLQTLHLGPAGGMLTLRSI
jgi:hypothetical protein